MRLFTSSGLGLGLVILVLFLVLVLRSWSCLHHCWRPSRKYWLSVCETTDCMQSLIVSLRALTTARLLPHVTSEAHDVKRPSRFTGHVWLATRYTTADSVVYIGGLRVQSCNKPSKSKGTGNRMTIPVILQLICWVYAHTYVWPLYTSHCILPAHAFHHD